MIGEIIGQQYEVTAMLGAGSMGEVYKGWDRALGRHVAIKVLKPDVGSGTERFRTEAQILASLNNGNICQVYSFLKHQGRDVMVLQHLDGTTLDEVLTQQGSLPWPEVKTIAADVLAGLTEAHHAKVVHRDLKPANLMRVPAATGFKTVIMDFGIARAQGQARATREGMVACTIEYASPEQIQGEEVGTGSDLYSLGMVLFELLTGELAFSAKTDAAWAHAHVYESPAWDKLTELHGKAVVQFLRLAVEKQPTKRYANAQAMLSALLQLPDESNARNFLLGRLFTGLSQTMASAKAKIRPSQPLRQTESLKSAPKPKTSAPLVAHAEATGSATRLGARLLEHWHMAFLALMVVVGLGFVLLSMAPRSSGLAPGSQLASPARPAVDPSVPVNPTVASSAPAPRPTEVGVAALLPANAELNLGSAPKVQPVSNPAQSVAALPPIPSEVRPKETSQPSTNRSRVRATSIE